MQPSDCNQVNATIEYKQLNATKWMQPSECTQVNATNWMGLCECNQVNATKWMQPNECNQVNATKWMQPSECIQLNATNRMRPTTWNQPNWTNQIEPTKLNQQNATNKIQPDVCILKPFSWKFLFSLSLYRNSLSQLSTLIFAYFLLLHFCLVAEKKIPICMSGMSTISVQITSDKQLIVFDTF